MIADLARRQNAAKPGAASGFGTKAAPAAPAPAPAPAAPAPAPAPAANKKAEALRKSNRELEALLKGAEVGVGGGRMVFRGVTPAEYKATLANQAAMGKTPQTTVNQEAVQKALDAENETVAGLAGRANAVKPNAISGFGTEPAPAPAPAPAPPPPPPPPVKNLPAPSGQAPAPAKPPAAKKAAVNRPFAKSAVDPFSTGMVMGSMALGLKEPPELSKYREALADVYDPVHETRMNAVKSKAMLNDFLSNDPILSSYDPEAVTNIYNQIAAMAPNAAQQPALMRGLLRKSIQQGGVIEPFEVQQLTQMESAFKGETPPHYSPLYAEKGSVKK
jgi:hypothetical protein